MLSHGVWLWSSLGALVGGNPHVFPLPFFPSFLKLYLFIFGCVESSSLRVGFLWLWQAGAAPHCCAQASLVSEHGLRSGGPWAQLLLDVWNLPELGNEPVSPALAGGLSTTGPPGKSLSLFLPEPSQSFPGLLSSTGKLQSSGALPLKPHLVFFLSFFF